MAQINYGFDTTTTTTTTSSEDTAASTNVATGQTAQAAQTVIQTGQNGQTALAAQNVQIGQTQTAGSGDTGQAAQSGQQTGATNRGQPSMTENLLHISVYYDSFNTRYVMKQKVYEVKNFSKLILDLRGKCIRRAGTARP